jgi:predicted amino acid racemase
MRDDAFVLEAEVIETNTKPTHPIGELGVDAFGKKAVYTDRGRRRRAILAIGRADYGDIDDLIPQLEGAEVAMASGDHTILDIEDCKEHLRVGDIVRFKMKYSALMRLTTSENVTIEEINRQ